jgi:ubiquitin C-terminal hydrolase
MKNPLTIAQILQLRAAAQLEHLSASAARALIHEHEKRPLDSSYEDDDVPERIEKKVKRETLTSSLTDSSERVSARTNTANRAVKPFTVLLWNVENYGEHKGQGNLFANKIIRHVLDRLNVDVAIFLETQSVPTDAIAGLEHKIADVMRTAREKKQGPGPDIAMSVRWKVAGLRDLRKEKKVWSEAVRVSGLDEEDVDGELAGFSASFTRQVKERCESLQGSAPAFHAITSSVTGRQHALPHKMGPYRAWPRTATRDEKKNDIARFKKIFSYDGSAARPTPHWLLSAYDDLSDVYDIRIVTELPEEDEEWPTYDDDRLTRPLTRDEIAKLRRCIQRLCFTPQDLQYFQEKQEKLQKRKVDVVAEHALVTSQLDEIDRQAGRAAGTLARNFPIKEVEEALDPRRIDIEQLEDYLPQGREERKEVATLLRQFERAVVLTLKDSARAVRRGTAKRPPRDVIGFVNDGNACYLLAVLQLLNRIPRDIYAAPARLRADADLARSAEQLLDAARTQAQNGTYGSTAARHPDVQVDPETNYTRHRDTRDVRRRLQARCGWASAADSEDAHEALVRLLQAFADPDAERSPLQFNVEFRSLLDHRNGRRHAGRADDYAEAIRENDGVWHRSHDVAPILSLRVPEGEKTLEQAFREALRSQNVGNITYCLDGAVWNAPVREQQVEYSSFPPHLLIRLERMWTMTVTADSGAVELLRGKHNDAVAMPEAFDDWRLLAFIQHHGATPENGHYTAHVLVGEQWYHVNDDTVTPVEDISNARDDGYIYYYGPPPGNMEDDPDDVRNAGDFTSGGHLSDQNIFDAGLHDVGGHDGVSDNDLGFPSRQSDDEMVDIEMYSDRDSDDDRSDPKADGAQRQDEPMDEETDVADECPLLQEIFELDPGPKPFGTRELRELRQLRELRPADDVGDARLRDVQDILTNMIGVRNVETYTVLFRADDRSRATMIEPIRSANHANIGHYVFKSGLLSTDALGQELGYQDPSVWINGRCPFYFEFDVWNRKESTAVRLPFLALHAPYGMPPEFRNDQRKKKNKALEEEPRPLPDKLKPIDFDGSSDEPLKMRADAMRNLLDIGIPAYEPPYDRQAMREFGDAIIAGDFNLDMCAGEENTVIGEAYNAMTAAGFESSVDAVRTTLLPVETRLSANGQASDDEPEWFGHAYDNILVRTTELKVATTIGEMPFAPSGTPVRGAVDVFDAIIDYMRLHPEDSLMADAENVIGTGAYYHRTRHMPATRANHELQRWNNNPDERAQAYFLYRRFISDHIPVFVDLDINSRAPLPPITSEVASAQKPLRHVIGIRNAGNSCYLNAALQLLWAFGDTKKWTAPAKQCDVDLYEELQTFIAAMAADAHGGTYQGDVGEFLEAGDRRTYYTDPSVAGIRMHLRRLARGADPNAFLVGRQEDAAEALHWILDACASRTDQTADDPDVPPLARAAAGGVDALLALRPSPVFFFTRTTRRYGKMIQIDGRDGVNIDEWGLSRHIESHNMLVLRLGPSDQTLQELFNANTRVLFPPNNCDTAKVSFRGRTCHAELQAEAFELIAPLPEFLVVHLARFGQDGALGGTGKLTTRIDPTAGLTLPDGTVYDLVGFIVHRGNTAKAGHYIACSLVGGQWWEINDSSVTKAPRDLTSSQKDAYVYLLRVRSRGGQ